MLPGHRVSARIIKRLLVTNYLAPINGMVFPSPRGEAATHFYRNAAWSNPKYFFSSFSQRRRTFIPLITLPRD